MNESCTRSVLQRVTLAGVECVVLIALTGCGHPQNLPSAPQSPPPVTPAPAPAPAGHRNSLEILAGCQPGLKESREFVPTFQLDEYTNRATFQVKVRFVVDGDGFATNAYLEGATIANRADQEAALDYVRHLTFEPPDGEECKSLKMQMVGNFHLAKDSTGDWTSIFDVHPVYSFSGNQVVVNPN